MLYSMCFMVSMMELFLVILFGERQKFDPNYSEAIFYNMDLDDKLINQLSLISKGSIIILSLKSIACIKIRE